MTSARHPADAPVADVLIGVAVDTAYSYRIPQGLAVNVGDFVDVPLGPRSAIGVIWAISTGKKDSNLKSIIGRRDLPPLRGELRQLIDWVANWTLAPRGMVLRMAIRTPERADPEKPRVGVRLVGPLPER